MPKKTQKICLDRRWPVLTWLPGTGGWSAEWIADRTTSGEEPMTGRYAYRDLLAKYYCTSAFSWSMNLVTSSRPLFPSKFPHHLTFLPNLFLFSQPSDYLPRTSVSLSGNMSDMYPCYFVSMPRHHAQSVCLPGAPCSLSAGQGTLSVCLPSRHHLPVWNFCQAPLLVFRSARHPCQSVCLPSIHVSCLSARHPVSLYVCKESLSACLSVKHTCQSVCMPDKLSSLPTTGSPNSSFCLPE
jgi:hypothetical protein